MFVDCQVLDCFYIVLVTVMHLCPICNRRTINVLDDDDDDDDDGRQKEHNYPTCNKFLVQLLL